MGQPPLQRGILLLNLLHFSFPSLCTAPSPSPSLLIPSLVTIVTITIMATDEALFVLLFQFLADENTQPEDLLALTAFLEARPAYSEPTSYISDIEQRLELLRGIRQECKKAKYEMEFTAALWSVLMVIPLERLRSVRDSPFLMATLESSKTNITILLKVCMLRC